MTKRKRGGMEAISALVARAYPSREPAELSAMRAFSWWNKVVPTNVLKNARPVRLYRGSLTVHTATSSWANSLQCESEQILAAIREHAPEANLKKILFRVGPLPELLVPTRQPKPSVKAMPLTELPESIARELSKIRDSRVREAVARAAAVGLAASDGRGPRSSGR
jgi:hypothetical protein